MNYKQLIEKQKANEEKIKRVVPNILNMAGVYIFHREENGIKYAYVGQAKNLLTRLGQHLSGYQHIDLSIKKHGLYSVDNLTGYKISYVYAINGESLDKLEQEYIKAFANNGYQLRNKTLGGQGDGKKGLDNQKQPKTYREGIEQGKKAVLKEIRELVNKYLIVSHKDNKRAEKGYKKFIEMLGE